MLPMATDSPERPRDLIRWLIKVETMSCETALEVWGGEAALPVTARKLKAFHALTAFFDAYEVQQARLTKESKVS
jgi:hypothetical protein